MSPIDAFARYAAAFEVTFKTDDWQALEPFFTPDAQYRILGEPPLAGHARGRDEVLGFLKSSLDTFDRRFDSREPMIREGPEERDGGVWMAWRVIYRRHGLPDLVVDGEETARFEGPAIRHLEDRYTPEMSARVRSYFEEHTAELRPSSIQ